MAGCAFAVQSVLRRARGSTRCIPTPVRHTWCVLGSTQTSATAKAAIATGRTAYARAASPLAGPRYARIAGPSPQTARAGRERPAAEQPLLRVARRARALVAGREQAAAGASASATLAMLPAWVAPSSRYRPAATLGCRGELHTCRREIEHQHTRHTGLATHTRYSNSYTPVPRWVR